MRGPMHYRMAETLLSDADDEYREGDTESARHMIAAAQVHATLAQAIATAEQYHRADDLDNRCAWLRISEGK